MDLNVKSPFFLTQALYPQLKAAASRDHPAKVINITSIDGIRLNPWDTFSYHASKSSLIYLTRRMAARCGDIFEGLREWAHRELLVAVHVAVGALVPTAADGGLQDVGIGLARRAVDAAQVTHGGGHGSG